MTARTERMESIEHGLAMAREFCEEARSQTWESGLLGLPVAAVIYATSDYWMARAFVALFVGLFALSALNLVRWVVVTRRLEGELKRAVEWTTSH